MDYSIKKTQGSGSVKAWILITGDDPETPGRKVTEYCVEKVESNENQREPAKGYENEFL